MNQDKIFREIFLVRHGESEENTDPTMIHGHSLNSPLSELGRLQSVKLGQYLRKQGHQFDQFITSNALRTQQTMELVLEQMGVINASVKSTPEILEISQGDWEGKPRSIQHTPEIKAQMASDYLNFKAPNGESQLDVRMRMLKFIEREIINQPVEESKTLLVGHGFAIRTLLTGILEANPKFTYRLNSANTGITILVYNALGWHVVSQNTHPHLDEGEFIKSIYTYGKK